MTYDPRKTQAENLADLQQQIDATRREHVAEAMAYYDLSDEEWDTLSTAVQDKLVEAYGRIY